ncbi:hypothetical protein [Streptomyces sp. NPDC058486]|uniref:hypothetical protein n=1 Tax=unclassified Streptomyces TaxID=2593676 RepID=UPI003666EF3F
MVGGEAEAGWELVDGRLRIRVDAGCGAVHRVQVPRDVAVSFVAVEGFTAPLKVRSEDGDVRIGLAGVRRRVDVSLRVPCVECDGDRGVDVSVREGAWRGG